MTKQEIEKAIENGESVWVANKYCYPYKVKLTNKHYVGVINDIKCLMLAFQNEDDELIDYLEYIFETKEKAQHYHDHSNITSVNQLPFLTWEEFNKNTLGFEFTDTIENKYRCHIVRDYRDGKDFIALYDKNGTISIDEEWEATEQNFYKAYDECVRLFKGEE